jgi:hypothetical protein
MMEAKESGLGKLIGTTTVRSGSLLNGQAGIVVLETNQLDGSVKEDLASVDGPLRDRVVLIIHPTPQTVGTFGETSLLTVDHGTIERLVPLGTSESDIILKEFAQKASTRPGRVTFDQDEEEEEI